MKVVKNNKLKSKAGAGNPSTMPSDLRDKLNGLTVNEAIERGFITDLGDAKGNFFFDHADAEVDAAYGIINGYAVRLSDGLKAGVDNVEDVIGDLRFTKGISTIEGAGYGKEFFRLGMPAGIRLGKEILTLAPETVETV